MVQIGMYHIPICYLLSLSKFSWVFNYYIFLKKGPDVYDFSISLGPASFYDYQWKLYLYGMTLCIVYTTNESLTYVAF